MKLSKTTYNTAKRYNVELCDSIENELHFIVDPENNDCASVAYQLSEDGIQYNLLHVWDRASTYPEVLKDEKSIRDLIKLMVK